MSTYFGKSGQGSVLPNKRLELTDYTDRKNGGGSAGEKRFTKSKHTRQRTLVVESNLFRRSSAAGR